MPADYTDTIVSDIISDLAPREKTIIAYMDCVDIESLEAILYHYTKGKGAPINDGKEILRRVWTKLYESHRLKVV